MKKMSMKKSSKSTRLLKLMLLEEYRLNTSMIGRVQFLFFPAVIGIFAFLICLLLPTIMHSVPMPRVYLIFHIVMAGYGLGVGGFALFGEHIAERRFGQVNLLLSTPTTQPVEFRTVFTVFYIKDTIYYLLFSIIPIVLGIGLSIPVTHFNAAGVLFLFLTATLSFLFGISFSFFLSSVYVRLKAAFFALVIGLAALAGYGYFSGAYRVTSLLPTLMLQYTGNPIYLLLSALLILFFSIIAVRFIKVEFGKKTERFGASVLAMREKFGFARGYSTFLAKEWLDMKRSRTLYPVMTAYIGPLVFIAVLQWFLKTALALPISFNLLFYAALIGFFGVTIYSWLNITDSPDFYQVLPVGVPSIIRAKLILLAIFTFSIPAGFLVALGFVDKTPALILPGIAVAFVTSTYTVMVTAYLTGLRTNSYLFDPRVLAKFAGFVIPPLIIIIIASFTLDTMTAMSSIVIACVCTALVPAIFLLYRGIEKRWARESFRV